jgi:hypothetical protein
MRADQKIVVAFTTEHTRSIIISQESRLCTK